MDLGLKDKPVLVFGSSAGIGKGIATEFAREGANVMLFSRSEEKLKCAQAEIFTATGNKPFYIAGDITNHNDIRKTISQTVEKFGSIYALVNNAGGPPAGTFNDFSDEEWHRAYELTLLSFIRTIREVIPIMKENGGGRILNVTSSTVKRAIDTLILSNTFRLGVIGLSKTLAIELGAFNILVNVLAPGRTDTERLRQLDNIWAENAGMTVEEFQQTVFKQIPLGRYGTPSELGKLAVFLCSEANTFFTGQTVLVDGGMERGY
jgi:3-oxoacyl-[acyl-carrier protein] reductase